MLSGEELKQMQLRVRGAVFAAKRYHTVSEPIEGQPAPSISEVEQRRELRADATRSTKLVWVLKDFLKEVKDKSPEYLQECACAQLDRCHAKESDEITANQQRTVAMQSGESSKLGIDETCTIENLIDAGEDVKYCGSDRPMDAPKQHRTDVLQTLMHAFQHYSLSRFNGWSMFIDIQGAWADRRASLTRAGLLTQVDVDTQRLTLIDVQTSNLRCFEPAIADATDSDRVEDATTCGDHGEGVIELFVGKGEQKHACSPFCDELKLKKEFTALKRAVASNKATIEKERASHAAT